MVFDVLLRGSTGQVVSRPDVVDIPVMVQRQVPLVLTVQVDHRASPAADIDEVVHVPVVQVEQVS